MSWVTIIWSMNAAVCLTLAGIHLVVWLKARGAWGHLLFSFSAVAAAATAACELLLMRAGTVEQYARVLWWAHVFLWVLIVSIVGFARFHLRAGRPWLAWTLIGARTLVLALSFLAAPNVSFNFKVITGLRHVPFLGESISMAEGTLNPWAIIGKLSSVLLLAFLVDVAIEVWRQGERRRALFLGGSMVFFATGGAVQAALVERGLIHSPYLISFAYLGIMLAMAYELSRDVLRATQLVRELQASEQRIALAANAANLGLWMWTVPQDNVWATEKLYLMLGYTPGEPITLDSFLARLHPEDRETTRHGLRRALEAKSDYEAEYRVVLPDGRHRWIAAHGRVDMACANGTVRMLGVCMDITQRK